MARTVYQKVFQVSALASLEKEDKHGCAGIWDLL